MALEPYGKAVRPLLEKYGAELLIAGSGTQFMAHFEGEWKEGACFILFKFPSMEALQSFWNSLEFHAVKHLRTEAAQTELYVRRRCFRPR